MTDEVRAAVADVQRDVRELRRVVERLDQRAEARVRAGLDATVRTVDALLATYRLLPDDAVLPPLATPFGGWSISADIARMLTELTLDLRPATVVDIGSGATTIILGYLLREHGGHLTCVEHHPIFYAQTAERLASRDLEDVVELRYAPLTDLELDGHGTQWYDPTAIEDLTDIDLVVVDGPPASTGPRSRWPAGPLLAPRCSEGAVFVLDDTVRDDERAIAHDWAELGLLEVVESNVWHSAGATILRRPRNEGVATDA